MSKFLNYLWNLLYKNFKIQWMPRKKLFNIFNVVFEHKKNVSMILVIGN